MCDMWKTGSSLEGSVGSFTRTSLRKTGWKKSKCHCGSITLWQWAETLYACLNTLFYCREDESLRTQEKQWDHYVKDAKKGWEKNFSGNSPHSAFLGKELCERGRSVQAELQCGAWKSRNLRFSVGKQPWYLSLCLQSQNLENTHCVGREIKILHLLLFSEGQEFSCGFRNLCKLKSSLLLLNITLSCSDVMLLLPLPPKVDGSVS